VGVIKTMIALNVLFLILYFVADWHVWVQLSKGLDGFQSGLLYEGVNVAQSYGIFSRSIVLDGHFRTSSSFEGFKFVGFSWNFPQLLFVMFVALNISLLVWEGRRCQNKGL